MKEALEKYGGSSLETTVNISSKYIRLPGLFFVSLFLFHPIFPLLLIFFWTVGETVEVGNFDPKIATFWIESGNGFFTVPPCV